MKRGRAAGPIAFVTVLTLSCVLVSMASSTAYAVQRSQGVKPAKSVQPAGATLTARAPALAFTGVTVVDVESGRLIPGQTVVVVGTRVQAIGDTGSVRPPAGARVVTATGKYLIPGLWDMHTHVQSQCAQDLAYPLFIANGVTSIRELNVPSVKDALRARSEVASGKLVGPRSMISGPALDPETRAPDCRGRPTHLEVANPERARHIVDSLRAAGVDVIKVYGGLLPANLFAILAEARRLGVPVGGHLTSGVTLAEASDSGQRSIEHMVANGVPEACLGGDDTTTTEATCKELATRLVHNGTWMTPTLSAGGMIPPDPNYLVQRFRAMYRIGLPILAGTDTEVWGEDLHYELQMFADGGMPPLEVLRAATLNPAKYFHATDSLGTVARGKLADLVLLDANPLADIVNTTTILAVVANGRYYDRAALNMLAAEGKQRQEAADREAAQRQAAQRQGN